MDSIGSTIRKHRRDAGWTLQRLADAAGCSKAYLSGMENGRLNNPPSERVLRAIERALEMEPGTLVRLGEWDATPERVRRDYRWLVRQLHKAGAPRAGEGAAVGVDLDALYASGALQRSVDDAAGNVRELPGGMARVPIVNHVAAGYPKHFTDLGYPARIADEYLTAPGVTDPDAFAARVIGDSMLPDYREGDIIVFSPAKDPADGSDCFVRLEPDHDTTFKRVYFEDDGDRVRLQPLNPKFPPRIVAREEVAGLYPAVFKMTPV